MPVVVPYPSISLSKQKFRSDLKLKLANSTEAELRSLQSSLQNSKDEVAADLQRSSFKKCVHTYPVPPPHESKTYYSYAQFVFISKDIGTLENDMVELKESLSEWKSMPLSYTSKSRLPSPVESSPSSLTLKFDIF
jgi:hypothetical protein